MEVQGYPPGVRFLPTPPQCIYYLTLKVTSQPLHCDSLFLDLDLYNPKQLPEILSSAERKGELYLFTKLRRKGKRGTTNVNRKVGKGTWHGDQKFDDVDDEHGTILGTFRKFSYREPGSPNDRRFLMTEYTLSTGTYLQYDPLRDYVLCHIVRNGRWHNGTRVRKSKRATANRQVAAAFEQPQPYVAAVTATGKSLGQSELNVAAVSAAANHPAACEDEQDDLLDILMSSFDYEPESPSMDTIWNNTTPSDSVTRSEWMSPQLEDENF